MKMLLLFVLVLGISALSTDLGGIHVPPELRNKYFIVCAKMIRQMFDFDFKFKCEYRDKLNEVMIEHGINNMWREVFFLAFMGANSNGWRMFVEQTDGSQYKSLFGNRNEIDGENFKMRGAGIWLFGRNDYEAFAEYINDPSRFEVSDTSTDYLKISSDFIWAITASAWKWKRLGLNEIADEAYLRNNYDIVLDTARKIKDRIKVKYDYKLEEYPIDASVFDRYNLVDMIVKCKDIMDPMCGFVDPYEFEGTSKAAYYKVFMSMFSTCYIPHPNWESAVQTYKQMNRRRAAGEEMDTSSRRSASVDETLPYCYVGSTDQRCSMDCEEVEPSEEEECDERY